MKRLLAVLFSAILISQTAYATPYGYGGYYKGDGPDASDVEVSTTDFDNNLSSSDNNVQTALNTLDELIASATPGGSSGQIQYNNSGSFGGVSGSSVSGSAVTFGSIEGSKIGSTSAADATFTAVSLKSGSNLATLTYDGTEINSTKRIDAPSFKINDSALISGASPTTFSGSSRFDFSGELSVGSNIDGLVDINGSSDQIQLQVQANGTQTSNILVVEDSAGTDYFTIDGTGDATFEQFANFDGVATFNSDVNFNGSENQFPNAAPYFQSLNANSVLFLDASKQVSEDNSKFYYNATTDVLTVESLDLFIPLDIGDTASGLTKRTITFQIDGSGSVISTGQKYKYVRFNFGMVIVGWEIYGNPSGSIVVDVWKDTYANFPPTVADTIAGSEKPTLSAAVRNQDTSLSTWTTSVNSGDIMTFNVDSASTVTSCTVVIYGSVTS